MDRQYIANDDDDDDDSNYNILIISLFILHKLKKCFEIIIWDHRCTVESRIKDLEYQKVIYFVIDFEGRKGGGSKRYRLGLIDRFQNHLIDLMDT